MSERRKQLVLAWLGKATSDPDDCGILTRELHELLLETNELIAILVTIVDRTKRSAA